MTDAELAAIRARCEAATEGPWDAHANAGYAGIMAEGDKMPLFRADGCTFADGTFIAHAREDVPALLDEVERLRTENERLRAELETVRGLLAEGRTTGHDIRAAALEAENHIIMLLNGDTALDAAGGTHD